MEAKDTVMSNDKLELTAKGFIGKKSKPEWKWIAQAQAEISFKAGEKEMFRKIRYALWGKPVVFDYPLDGVEIKWLCGQTKKLFNSGNEVEE